MMPKSVIFLCLLLALALQGKPYVLQSRADDDPCYLATVLAPLMEYSDYSLFTCIAGYHSVSDLPKPSSGKIHHHHRIPAIHSEDFNNCMVNEIQGWLKLVSVPGMVSIKKFGFSAEMTCLKKVIYESEELMTLYKRLCRPELVKAVQCGAPEVVAFVPLYRAAFALDLSNPPNDDLFKFAELLDGLMDEATSVSSTSTTPNASTQNPSSDKDADAEKRRECGEAAVVSSAIPETTMEGTQSTSGSSNISEVIRTTTSRGNVTSETQHEVTGQPARPPSTTPSSESEPPLPSSIVTYRNFLKLILISIFIYLLVKWNIWLSKQKLRPPPRYLDDNPVYVMARDFGV